MSRDYALDAFGRAIRVNDWVSFAGHDYHDRITQNFGLVTEIKDNRVQVYRFMRVQGRHADTTKRKVWVESWKVVFQADPEILRAEVVDEPSQEPAEIRVHLELADFGREVDLWFYQITEDGEPTDILRYYRATDGKQPVGAHWVELEDLSEKRHYTMRVSTLLAAAALEDAGAATTDLGSIQDGQDFDISRKRMIRLLSRINDANYPLPDAA